MRLINTTTLQLAGPFLTAELPPYAILSHTWGPDELCYQDMSNMTQHMHKRGFLKMQRFCQRALQDGYLYGWVDTVCIDKTSSAELSEAINSMYRWYQKSAMCYVVLEDLFTYQASTTLADLQKCKWFTRAWTLQELIAPRAVVFVNFDWVEVGRKLEVRFCRKIINITRIDGDTLTGLSPKRLSIATRMSWASERQSTRPEDLAYCLLGLFGIAIPLLYGEGGTKAFIRLQEEILRSSDDHTIFAWSTEAAAAVAAAVGNSSNSGSKKRKHWGLLAPSPEYFRFSAGLVPVRGKDFIADHAITNRGLHLKHAWTNSSHTRLILNCRPRNSPQRLCTIPIVRLRTGPHDFARSNPNAHTQPLVALVSFPQILETATKTEIYARTNIHEEDFEDQHLVDYLHVGKLPSGESGYEFVDRFPSWSFDVESFMIRTSPFPKQPCGAVLMFQRRKNPEGSRFAVTLFADGVSDEDEKELGDTISQDIVGVYHTTWDAEEFYDKGGFGAWFAGGREQDFPRAAEFVIQQDGRQVWKLDDDDTFVRVTVSRDTDGCLGSMAVAEIEVGRFSKFFTA